MKINILILHLFVLATFLYSCNKKIEAEDFERPDSKIAAKITAYTDLLASSPGGWIGYLYPAYGGGFTFKFNFDKDQKVKMTALLNDESVNNTKESLYSIRVPQVPSLYFDTYSYIHELADPIITKYGGQRLVGAGGDFEFSFVSASPDTIKLKGNFRGSDLILVKADPLTADSYLRAVYSFTNNTLSKINSFKHYYKKLTYKGKDYLVIINTDKSTFNIYHQHEGLLRWFSTEYAVSEDGILLKNKFDDNNILIESFSNFQYDINGNKLEVILNYGREVIEINSVESPVFIYKEGPAKLFGRYNRQFSTYGFNYDGIKDYHNLHNNPSLIGNSLKQRFYINNLDRMEFYYYNSSNMEDMFYCNLRGNINTADVIKFEAYANFGNVPTGSPLLSAVENFKSFLRDPDGFYVFSTGEDLFDLVSAGDSRKWFRFY